MSRFFDKWKQRFEDLFSEVSGDSALSRAEYIELMEEIESIASTNAEASRDDDRREEKSE